MTTKDEKALDAVVTLLLACIVWHVFFELLERE